MTETALAELLAADLSGLDLVALIIDGVYFAESCCLVATGIGIDGVKHPLALVQGSAENATLVTELLVDLRQRGLDVTRPMLVGLDGSKALRNAVLDVLDHPVIQRCQLHKIRNVKTICTTTSVKCRPQDGRCPPRRLSAGGRSRAAVPGPRA
jgi:transposase-like protein